MSAQHISLQWQVRDHSVHFTGLILLLNMVFFVAQSNSSTIIEVRLRPPYAQSRYRLDVFADKRRIYFDRPALKIQHFPGQLLCCISIAMHFFHCYYYFSHRQKTTFFDLGKGCRRRNEDDDKMTRTLSAKLASYLVSCPCSPHNQPAEPNLT